MPVFNNISDVLTYVGTADARFLIIKRPGGFNHWFDAKTQLEEDNPSFFADGGIDIEAEIGVLTTESGHQRGFMVIMKGSRYVVTNWTKSLVYPRKPTVRAGAIAVSIRQALREGLWK